MEQDVRNKLQRATQQVRQLLETEFTEQLEGTFDILPDGKILPEAGKHLDARQKLVRRQLVDAIEHIKAGGKQPKEAVDEYTREAAFTFLNRFVALRMLEARGMLQQCVSKGDQSSGFKEFCGLAPGLSDLPDGGYRLYLECLCDELSVEVKVLFDRRDSASLLWPRRGALTEMLDILGQTDLAGVWNEDETIGWVYQYFNSGEERKAMRDASQAPRNSRELAVRNQFFTPRYVVEFLTDNTLGRIWYEMRQGQTRLVDECRYLVRRPSEVFLAKGEEPPPEDDDAAADLSQEELLQKTVYIPHRAKKDPRDLKILDPACGSGHFLLYAFDLLLSIYDEAWEEQCAACKAKKAELDDKTGLVEQKAARAAVKEIGYDYSTSAFCPLPAAYSSVEQLHAALPSLVLAHNLHGIDIDPRAAQIAALALWMRGQRAFNDFGISRDSRPAITKSNIVCAEPMPGEAAFLDEFIAEHLSDDAEGRFLASLIRKVFEAMKLAGEAGSLLKIEEDIAEEVAKAKKQWLERPELKQRTFFDATTPKPVQKQFDLTRGITDAAFWEEAEQRIYDALRAYAERADENGGIQRRLFAADAARGFAFVDLCRHRYDVALMNPPFGECSAGIERRMRKTHSSIANDMYALFVVQAATMLQDAGTIGAISSRGFLAGRDQRKFRPLILGKGPARLNLFIDLGLDVLDGAAVETCMYVIRRDNESHHTICFVDLRGASRSDLGNLNNLVPVAEKFAWTAEKFLNIKDSPILYSATDEELQLLSDSESFDPDWGRVTMGLSTGDNERFIRLWWEIPFDGINHRWRFCAKGGEYTWFVSNIKTVVDWTQGGNLLTAYRATVSDNIAQAKRSSQHYFKPGMTYTYRCNDFSVRALPKGCIFTTAGPAIITNKTEYRLGTMAMFATERYAGLLKQIEKKGKYDTGRLGKVPGPSAKDSVGLSARWEDLVQMITPLEQQVETSPYFAKFIAASSDPVAKDAIRRSIVAFVAESGLTPSVEFTDLGADAFANRYTVANRMQRTLSYAMGLAFGRYGDCNTTSHIDLFAPLIDQFPAIHRGATLPRHSVVLEHTGATAFESPLYRSAIAALTEVCGESIVGDEIQSWDLEAVHSYLRSGNGFFADHIAQYSGAFRRAPIYWQLATPSASWSVWLYYHRLTRDTFFQVLNEYVTPKLDHERQKLERIRGEGGAEPTRSQRTEIEDREKFVAELAAMAEEVERIAPLWSPNLNDGVIINFAPLWRLVPQNKSWQKECKSCWDKLVAGDYDWAHLAMHLWPERVAPNCHSDRSLAIAHDIEDLLWVEDGGKWRPIDDPDREVSKLNDRHSSTIRDDARDSLSTLADQHGKSHSADEAFKRLIDGEWDDSRVSLLIWPNRVIRKCVDDEKLAKKHEIEFPVTLTKAKLKKFIEKKTKELRDCRDIEQQLAELLKDEDRPFAQVWNELSNGERDDERLALSFWPERVIDKCGEDHELADEHGLIHFLWTAGRDGAVRRRLRVTVEIADEVQARTSPAMKASLTSLLEAPVPSGTTRKRKAPERKAASRKS